MKYGDYHKRGVFVIHRGPLERAWCEKLPEWRPLSSPLYVLGICSLQRVCINIFCCECPRNGRKCPWSRHKVQDRVLMDTISTLIPYRIFDVGTRPSIICRYSNFDWTSYLYLHSSLITVYYLLNFTYKIVSWFEFKSGLPRLQSTVKDIKK